LAIGYGSLCILLHYQQQQLMVFPVAQLAHTPSFYQLPYEEVWLPIATAKQTDRIHAWWIPAAKPDAPIERSIK
jgi:uncharacterized protein